MLKGKFVKANTDTCLQFFLFDIILNQTAYVQDRIEVKLLGIRSRRFALIKEKMSAKNSPTIYIQRN